MIPTIASQSVLCGDSPFFQGCFSKTKIKTMAFETHCMSCPFTELLFKYAKINSISNSRAPLSKFQYVVSR